MSDKPIVYQEDGITYYRASALGSCLRALFAARSGMLPKPPPPHMQAIFDTGHELEPKILNLLYDEHNFTFADGGSQKEVTLEITPEIFVIGHIDEEGCSYVDSLKRDSQPYLSIDVKGFGQSLVDTYRTKGITALPHYAWQQSVYSLALGHRKFYMPIYNKDTERIEPWSLTPVVALYDLQDITERILLIERAVRENDMPPCTLSYPCGYYYMHDEPKPSDTLPDESIPLLRVRMALKNKITNYTSTVSELDKKIRALLTPDTPYTLEGNHIKVIPNPPKFNTTAAKALLTDAEIDWQNDPLFIIPGEGYQLRITKPKEKKDGGTQE